MKYKCSCSRYLESRLLQHPGVKQVAVRGVEVEGVGKVRYLGVNTFVGRFFTYVATLKHK